ncbi:MFS transporter [Kribbella sp. NBC_01505]|uniref:MFS transporter n=1 Tax=Kribbella sp. NBC_01505 TaxID=2903580 RepID=UPI00386CF498
MLGRRASFVIAGAAGAATLTAASAPSPLYPVYQHLWGFSAFVLTLIFAVYVFALLAALLTVGSLSDRVGRRPVASVALVVLALGMVLFALADGTEGLIIARIVQGLAVGAATSTTTAMITDSAPNPRLGSIVSSAVPALGITIGAVLAGVLVEFAPLPRQLVFWILTLVFLLLAGLVWLVPERVHAPSTPRESIWRSLLPRVGLPAAVRPVFFGLLPSICATWALAGLYLSLGSSVLTTVVDLHSHFVVGLVLGAFFLAGAAGSVVSTTLAPKHREWFGYGALVVGVLVTIVATALGASLPYLVGSVIAGLGFGAAFRFAVHALGDVAPDAERGQVFSTMYIASYLAFSVPALVAGLAVEQFGLKPTALAYGGLEIVLVLIAMLAAKRRATPTPAPTSQRFDSPRQSTHYLECGPADGPLMFFLHGWPAIGLFWHAQLETFAADGWRCIAPDLRGYGGSSAPATTTAYGIEEVVADLIELHDHLGGASAIWVGHDWGSAVVGALAAHEPDRCRGAVLTSWAYFPEANSLATLVPLVDRAIYPVDDYPDGQWDYYRYYTTHFEEAVDDLDADPAATLASIYQPGNPDVMNDVAPAALVTRNGGRFGDAHHAPPTEPDPALWPPADFDQLVRAFKTQGFRPTCAWYTNDDANIAYARTAPNDGCLSQPVLFINGDWDVICTITGNRQGDPMRASCTDLTETSLPAGHWLPLERKAEHIQAIRTWLQTNNL